MLIRRANLEDVANVIPMVQAICELHEQRDPQRFRVLPDVLDRYAGWLPDRVVDPRSIFFVGERADGSLGAFTVGTVEPEIPIFWTPECGWIHDLWVEPQDRRSGVASQLIEAAAARFETMGVTQVRLHTAAFNETARELFTRCGFRPCVVEMLRAIGGT